MPKILVVEDEYPIALVLKVYLEKAGYQVDIASDGEVALKKFFKVKPALVLLDLMLPELDGRTVLKEIRMQSSCPVLILTALGAIPERLQGFQLGADDYITKPFDPEEIVARVQAVLRRPMSFVEEMTVGIGCLKLDFKSCSTFLQGKLITIAPRDWGLLAFLTRHPNQVFTRAQLLDDVWGMDYDGGDRAVDLAIKRLRKSLQDWPVEEGEIITVRGMGYSLRAY
jgi:DNA-binding response OmpR family regulator